MDGFSDELETMIVQEELAVLDSNPESTTSQHEDGKRIGRLEIAKEILKVYKNYVNRSR